MGSRKVLEAGHLSFLSCLLLICLMSSGARAQSAQEQAIERNQQVIQQFEQERRQRLLEEQIEREREALGTDLRQKAPEAEPEGPCVQVDSIMVRGVSLFRPNALKPITKAYTGRCLYLSDISVLAEEITNLYIEYGYITTRTYVPAQDLSDGTLELEVIEGRLERIEYETNRGSWQQREIDMAFPEREGEPLYLRDIEQGLDQMNRLQSNEVRMELLPGTGRGATILKIVNQKSKPWQVRTALDNTGSESTGEWQGTIGLDYDNAWDINDLLSLTFKHDLEGADRRQSRSFAGRYEIPFGYWNLYYGLSYFDYVSEVSTGAANFKTTGFSRIHDLGLRRVLHRDQDSKTNLSFSLVAKENENFLSGNKLDASSQKLTIFNLGLSHSQQLQSGFLYAAINYSRGTGWLGAQEDKGLASDAPKAEFDRVTADLSAIRLWDAGLKELNPLTELTARGQWSADALFGSEQISVGGPFSVRGFKAASLSGETGYYVSLDVSVPLVVFEETNVSVGRLRPFLGFDTGTVKSDDKNPLEGGTLRSWTVGLKNEGGRFDFEFAYSEAVSSPHFIDPEHQEIFFSVSAKF